MPTIKFTKEKKEIQVPAGTNLRSAAYSAGVNVYQGVEGLLHCPGLGLCATCAVLVTKGMENVSPLRGLEKQRLKFSLAYIGREANMRLSCQTQVNGDVEVETHPGMNLYGDNFFS